MIRTEVVGSLLRPASWRAARAQFDDGRMSADERVSTAGSLPIASLPLETHLYSWKNVSSFRKVEGSVWEPYF